MDHDRDVTRIVEGRCRPIDVASSKFHFGEAIRQMSFEKSRRYLS